MKKICIALDYTPLAEKVAATGYALARAIGAEVTLVHVITDVTYSDAFCVPNMGYNLDLFHDKAPLYEEVEHGAEDFLNATVLSLRDQQIKKVVLEGPTADAILNYATEHHMDLIVMGTHGHSGLESFIDGQYRGPDC